MNNHIDPFSAGNLEANAGLAATLWHQFCELTKCHEGNPPLDWWGFKWAAYAMAGLEALPRAGAVSAPRCPSDEKRHCHYHVEHFSACANCADAQAEYDAGYRAAHASKLTPSCPKCGHGVTLDYDDENGFNVMCGENKEHYWDALCFQELAQFFQPEAQPSPWVSESAWLIERAGLCLGICEYRLKWVTFTDPNAIRFSRQADAYALQEALKWEPFKLFDQMQGAMPTEHMWSGPAQPSPEGGSKP